MFYFKELLRLLPVLRVLTKCVRICIYTHTHLIYIAVLSQISKKLFCFVLFFFPLKNICGSCTGFVAMNSLMFEVLFFVEDWNGCVVFFQLEQLLILLLLVESHLSALPFNLN